MSRAIPTGLFRPIPGYEGLYDISSDGEVYSYHRNRMLQNRGVDKDGYPIISLSKEGKRSTFAKHRIVCRVFHGEPPFDGAEAAHKDGDRTNPKASNLVWSSKAENASHKVIHGTVLAGELHPRARLTDEQVSTIRAFGRDKIAHSAVTFGVSQDTIRDIISGRRRKTKNPIAWLIAAHEAGRADPDPFFERKETL